MELNRSNLIQDIFQAFSHRHLLWDRDRFWANEEANELREHLAGVLPQQLTLAFLESCPVDEMYFLSSMKARMALCYVPSFLAMAIEDYSRVEMTIDSVLHWFRSNNIGWHLLDDMESLPADMFIEWLRSDMAKWPAHSWEDTPRTLSDLKDWYFHGFRPEDNQYIALLTRQERHAFCAFFGYMQENVEGFRPHCGVDWRATYAARALLCGNSMSEALGATTPSECRHLVDVLDLLEGEFTEHFPRSRTTPIKAVLASHIED